MAGHHELEIRTDEERPEDLNSISTPTDDFAGAIGCLKQMTKDMSYYNRSLAIAVVNMTESVWSNPEVYFEKGTSDEVLKDTIRPTDFVTYSVHQWPSQRLLAGTSGVFCYRIYTGHDRSIGHTVAVMFSVPYDRNLRNNWWNVKVYKNIENVSAARFYELYKWSENKMYPFKGDGNYHEKTSEGFHIRGVMSDSSTASLMVTIQTSSQ